MDNLGFQNIQKKLRMTLEDVSKTLGVELFTVQQWACGIWEIPEIAARSLRLLLSSRRDTESMKDVYMAGYRAGLKEGQEKVVNDDADADYRAGYIDGIKNKEFFSHQGK